MEPFDPFNTGPARRRSPLDNPGSLTPGAAGIVAQTLNAEATQARQQQAADVRAAKRDPLDDQISTLNERRTNLRLQQGDLTNKLHAFVENEGADLFERDPLTNKPMKGADGAFVPKMGAEIDSLRAKAQQKTGLLGSLVSSKAQGDPTDEATAAQARLAQLEPTHRLKMEKFQRIQDELKRIDDADKAHQAQLAEVARQREARYTVTPQDVASAVQSVNAGRAMTGQRPIVPEDVNAPAPRGPQRTLADFDTPDVRRQMDANRTPGHPFYPKEVFAPVADPATGQPAGQSIAPEAVESRVKSEADRLGLPASAAHVVEVDQLKKLGVTHIGNQSIDEFAQPPEAVGEAKLVATVNKLKAELNQIDAATGPDSQLAEPVRQRMLRQRAITAKLLEQKEASPQYQAVGTFLPELRRGAKNIMAGNAAIVGALTKPFAWVEDKVASALDLKNYEGAFKRLGDFAVESNDYWNRGAQGETSKAPQSVTDVGGAGDFGRWFVGQIGQQLPVMADLVTTTLAMGGTNLGAKAVGVGKSVMPTALLPLFERAVAKGQIAGAALSKIGGSPAALAAASKSEFGSIYSDMLEMGREEGDPHKYDSPVAAAVFGVIAGSLESLPVATALKKLGLEGDAYQGIMRKALADPALLKRMLASTGEQVALEGSTEFLQTWVENAAKSWVNENRPLFTEENYIEALNAAASGAAIGGATGVVTGVKRQGEAGATPPPAPGTPPAPVAPVPGAPVVKENLTPAAAPAPAGETPTVKDSLTVDPAPAAPNPTVSETATVQPEATLDQQPEKSFEFTNRAGKTVVVTAPRESQALAKLPEDFGPVASMKRAQNPTAKLQGEQINREWTAFAPESQTLGIPRAEMPQVKAEHRGALTQFLKARGIAAEETEVKPSELKPTQAEYAPGKVAKAREFKGGDRAILISSDNHVVDGHHQWMAKFTDAPAEPMRVIRLNAPIKDVLAQMKEFPSVENAGGATQSKAGTVTGPAETSAPRPAAPAPVSLTPGGAQSGQAVRGSSEATSVSPAPLSQPVAPSDQPQKKPTQTRAPAPAAPLSTTPKPPTIPSGMNKPATFIATVSKASSLKAKDKATRFLTDFVPRLHRANPKAFRDMEVHVLNQKEWDEHPRTGSQTPDSSAAYNPDENTLFINSDKVKGNDGIDAISAIVHEAGHFAERFALGDALTQREWEKLTHAQRVQARKDYDGADMSGDAVALLKDARSRSEWVAQQFARVVRGETDQMPKNVAEKLKAFLETVRELVRKWVGAKSLTTAELDAWILDKLGYAKREEPAASAPGKPIETAVPAPGVKPSDARPAIREGSSGQNVTAPKGNGKRFGVGESPDGNRDLLNAIEDLGGIRHPDFVKNRGGEYDGFAETFRQGVAKLLIRRTDTAPTVDQLMTELVDEGFNFRTADELYAGVTKAINARASARKKFNAQEYNDKFDRAFLANEHPRAYLRAGQAITVDDLRVGDKFEVDGEKFEVKNIDDDGNVTVKDGITRVLPPGTPVYPDRGEVKHKKGVKNNTEFLTKDDFALAEPTEAEKAASEEAKRKREQAEAVAEKAAAPIKGDVGDQTRDMFGGGDMALFDAAQPTAPAKPAKFNAALKDQARAAFDGLLGTPPTVSYEDGIPADRAAKFLPLAQQMVADGINTPQAVAEFLEETFGGKARKFSQSLWNFLSFADPKLTGRQDWAQIYRALDNPVAPVTVTPAAPPANEPSPNGNLERDRAGAAAPDGGSAPDVRPERGSDGAVSGDVAGAGAPQSQAGRGVDDDRAAVDRAGSDSGLPPREPGTLGFEAGTDGGKQSGGGRSAGESRVLVDAGADTAVRAVTPVRPSTDVVAAGRERTFADRLRDQRAAERVAIKDADLANIRETLPVLLPEQHDDVLKAERRLLEQGKRGILFTNGTGTGKTFTGLGVMKRAVRRGAKNILVVVPTNKKAVDWKHDATHLGLKVNVLEDTSTAGTGINATTYANFRTNDALKNRDFDLVVYDESHKIVQNETGSQTSAFDNHQWVTNHPRVQREKAATRIIGPRPVFPGDKASANEKEAYDIAAQRWREREVAKAVEIDAERKRLDTLTDVVFLSATPFAYHKTLNYADGYLFDSTENDNESRRGGYNVPQGFESFLVANFGYRMRYNKVTQPEAGVDVDLMERAFADRLMKEGAMSGRSIDVPYDYSREFIRVDPGLGAGLDRGMKVLFGWTDRDENKYEFLPAIAKARFPYHYVQQLMEAIKVAQSLDRIRAHIALDRKIVLFHGYVNATPGHPFRGLLELAEGDKAKEAEVRAFEAKYPDLLRLDFGPLSNPLALLKREFGDQIVFFNGNESNAKKLRAVDQFNDDASPVKIIAAQADSMAEGVSAHDTTGKFQRVVMNVGLPVKPTLAIQEEGRAYRVGVRSNAIYEYITLHTDTERYAFGSKINERVRTAENLALGSGARQLQDSFKDGYLNPNEEAPSTKQGLGGKAADRAAAVVSDFERAKTFYFSRQKKTSKTKAQEGTDYFATPEPLGLKMVEWLRARPNEKLLEPSAGHGAIGRFFPAITTNAYVEPSAELSNELRIKVETGEVHVQRFEDLNVVNKYDGIAMNPPFGQGGSTAIAHLAKAATHLRNGGRIVALIPEGPAADAKFAKWYENAGKQFIKIAEFGLPSVTFERAGTSVKTRIVVIDRIDNDDQRTQSRSQQRIDLSGETIGELFEEIESRGVPDRTNVAEAEKPAPVPAPARPLATRDAVLPASAAPAPSVTSAKGDFEAASFAHTKTGATVFVAKSTRRLSDAEYSAAKRAATRNGGHYSNFKGAGAIPGFHFKTAEARDAFVAEQGRGQSNLLGTPPVRGTPAQEAVLAKVNGTLEDKRGLGERMRDYLADLKDYVATELKQKLLDSFASIKRLERANFGQANLDASVSAYKAARLTKNLPSVMDFLMNHGQLEYRDGGFAMKQGGEGLMKIFKPLIDAGTLRLWEGYVTAFRANRLLAEGKESNFGRTFDPVTGKWSWDATKAQAEIDELLALGKQYPEFETVRQGYVAFQKSILDVAEAAGLINPGARALWEKSDYVPFYRITETLDGTKGPGKRRGIANQRSGIKQLKGGAAPVAIMENIVRNIEQMVDASFKNVAMQRVADLATANTDMLVKIPYQAVPFKASVAEVLDQLEKAGVDTSGLSTAEAEEFVKFWRMRAPTGKDVVSVMVDGKAIYYRVKDPALLRSVQAMGPRAHSAWMSALMAPKNLLTRAVTLDPAFMAANTIRDSFSAWAIADTPIRPGLDAATGFLKSLRNDPSKLAIMAAGGGTGHYNNLRDGKVRDYIRQLTPAARKSFLESIVDTPAKAARLYADLGRATENANRIAIADSVRARGGTDAEAAYQALDIMDFGLRGDSTALNFFLDVVPFLNARIQGLYRLGRGLKDNPKRVATHGALIMGATLGLLAANWDDERYWALPEWERDIYYHFWLGDQHVRIPKPFEVGQIFSTVPERLLEFVGKTGDGKLLAKRMATMVADTFAMNPLPQVMKPAAERAMNLNTFTGGRIISRGDEFKSPEQQFGPNTSETLRELAQAMPDGAPEWLRSPKTLEHFVRGYFGSLGMYALTAADALTREAGNYPEKPESVPGDLWVMKRFAPSSDTKETKYVAQFYDLHQEISALTRQIKELAVTEPAQARAIQAENAELLRFAPRAESTFKALQGYRKQEERVLASPTTPARKREEIAAITDRRNQTARQAMEASPRRPWPIYNPFGASR